ncbi:MAG: hypothetical protein KY475_19710 [Planctomycetes bacterium]|nr:hypothetical protein [Planctomycetota bacterium]
MIVPPRLVAGCLCGCAAAMLLASPPPAWAQSSQFQPAAASQYYAEGAEAELGWGDPRRPRGLFTSWFNRSWAPQEYGYGYNVPARNGAWQEEMPEGVVPEGFSELEPIEEGAPIPDELHGPLLHGEPGELVYGHAPGDAFCGDGCCNPCGPADCCLIPCLGLPHNFTLYAGVHGFKGPANRGSDSSFGFDEAINWGGPLCFLGCGVGELGAQLGARGAHSNLSGATGLTVDDRNQLFVTGGLFRRVDCGLQFGAVIDYLREDWDLELDLAQIRGELSWVFVNQSEAGVRYHGAVSSDTSTAPAAVAGVNWESTDLFAFFVRQKFPSVGAECQLYAGFSAESEGLIGADMLLPLADHVAVITEFTYLVPEEGAAAAPIPGSIQESWNLGLGVVVYPDAGFLNPANYYRPLFNVAHNGSFLYDID